MTDYPQFRGETEMHFSLFLLRGGVWRRQGEIEPSHALCLLVGPYTLVAHDFSSIPGFMSTGLIPPSGGWDIAHPITRIVHNNQLADWLTGGGLPFGA